MDKEDIKSQSRLKNKVYVHQKSFIPVCIQLASHFHISIIVEDGLIEYVMLAIDQINTIYLEDKY